MIHQSAVHPHVCGEHIFQKTSSDPLIGSSPRVWGTLPIRQGSVIRYRFIPTCVGNTSPSMIMLLPTTVHPHVCGEHTPSTEVSCALTGSSPRVWGTLFRFVNFICYPRFIPTCVGNTLAPHAAAWSPPVHPHVCGEHRYGFRIRALELRFIPTCVGNTNDVMNPEQSDAVHPHVCGEHMVRVTVTVIAAGSSPRVWGTPGNVPEVDRLYRFIPTCVGNTGSGNQ